MQCSDFPQIRLPAGALPGRVTTHPLRLSPQILLPTTTISSITIYTQSPEISRRLSLSKMSRQTRVPMDEFPQLKELGLRIVHTMGDGTYLLSYKMTYTNSQQETVYFEPSQITSTVINLDIQISERRYCQPSFRLKLTNTF